MFTGKVQPEISNVSSKFELEIININKLPATGAGGAVEGKAASRIF